MPRHARTQSESGYYHIVNRGIGKQLLFEDAEDYRRFLYTLKRCAEEERFEVICYCLMENHFHLVLHVEAGLDRIMKKLCGSYAYYYNEKYERSGHLFQDRFRSEAITDDRQLLAAVRYVHNNPQKAGICPREKYPWSSWREYTVKPFIVVPDLVIAIAGSMAQFLSFSAGADSEDLLDDGGRVRLSDTQGMEIIRSALGLKSGTQLQEMDRVRRDAALRLLKRKGLSVRQIERLTGINRGIIQKA